MPRAKTNKVRKPTNFEKDEVIADEIVKLSDCFKNIPTDKRKIVDGLISNAAFMFATLQELALYSDKYGVVEHTADGVGTKESSAIKSYNTMINRYNTVIKQLCDLLPDNNSLQESTDDLVDFIKK